VRVCDARRSCRIRNLVEDPVRYATTADGVRIAYCETGRGRPILSMPPLPLRHLERELELPEDRQWIERLGRARRVVRYDPRGMGLSSRAGASFTLDSLVLDLAAVVDALQRDDVVLFACLNTVPIAISYAARFPGRISHLILWSPVAKMADATPSQILTLLDVAAKDWELFTEAAANVMVGWSRGEAAHRYADYLRACIDRDTARRLVEGLSSTDVTPLLGEVRVPTLVLHRRDVTTVPVAAAVETAAQIPGAQLVLLDGELMRPGAGDIEQAARAVDVFLGDDATPAFEPRPTANTFRREGEYWTLCFDGTLSRLRDARGLHHIARLLREPGLEVAASELVADGGAQPLDDDAGPVLDQQSKAAYKRRVGELRAEIEAAEANGDANAGGLREDLDFVTRQLSAAVGLGGRDRKASSTAERARLTATKRIKDAIERIRACDPALARHLARTIKTGHLCAYRPDVEAPVAWTF
jgi:pimeloyl-ACP methyl ester carboxylesterase